MILIADSGSTKTHWTTIVDHQVNQDFFTQGINPYFLNSSEIKELLLNELPLKEQSLSDVKTIYFYGAGCSNEMNNIIVYEALKACMPNAEVHVEHDLLAAARALCGSSEGIACILGTGSNSCFYDGKVIVENVPSFGYLFGDHGSGAYLGKQFVQLYFDGKCSVSLSNWFEGIGYNREVILENTYKKNLPNRYLASIAKDLKSVSHIPEMQQFLKQCFSDFIEHQVSKYQSHKNVPIHITGSIAFYFAEEISSVFRSSGLKLGKIMPSPMPGLVEYHTQPL